VGGIGKKGNLRPYESPLGPDEDDQNRVFFVRLERFDHRDNWLVAAKRS
jgi:hypothetical protein